MLQLNITFFVLETKKVTKSAGWRKGCREFWGSYFEACPRIQLVPPRFTRCHSNSIAYSRPSQQASK